MKTVVVGGGIAGLRAAKRLRATLITDSPTLVFKPTLTDTLRKGIRAAQRPITHEPLILERVDHIDLKKRTVHAGIKKHRYDVLIVATGARPLAPIPGVERYATPFYNEEDAEKVIKEPPTGKVVIIGGGPTGVELAIELSRSAQVTVLHGGERILEGFSEETRHVAQRKLHDAGVQVYVEYLAKRINKSIIRTNHEDIPYDHVFWTAGVKPNIPQGLPDERGVPVDEYLRVRGQTNVFAIGDCSDNGPRQAQAALQQADHTVSNVKRLSAGRPLKPFEYRDKGRILGLADEAVITAGPFTIKGRFAGRLRDAYYAWILNHY